MSAREPMPTRRARSLDQRRRPSTRPLRWSEDPTRRKHPAPRPPSTSTTTTPAPASTRPLVQGGQGRTPDDVALYGEALLVVLMIAGLIGLIVAIATAGSWAGR